jgi:hypothetical protein
MTFEFCYSLAEALLREACSASAYFSSNADTDARDRFEAQEAQSARGQIALFFAVLLAELVVIATCAQAFAFALLEEVQA